MKSGFSAVEFVIALAVLAVALIPIFSVFTESSKAVFKSKLAYMAIVAAQEKVEEIRQLPFANLDQLNELGWQNLTGSAFKVTKHFRNDFISTNSGAPQYGAIENEDFHYPKAYERIFLKVTVNAYGRMDYGQATPAEDPLGTDENGYRPPRMKKVTVEYFWQEKGENEDEALRRHYSSISTIVGSHNAR